jgi:hypothetical protein
MILEVRILKELRADFVDLRILKQLEEKVTRDPWRTALTGATDQRTHHS